MRKFISEILNSENVFKKCYKYEHDVFEIDRCMELKNTYNIMNYIKLNL